MTILTLCWIRTYSVSHRRYLNVFDWNHRTFTGYEQTQHYTALYNPWSKKTSNSLHPPLSVPQQTSCPAPAAVLEALMLVGAFWKGYFSVWQCIHFVLRVWMRFCSLKKNFRRFLLLRRRQCSSVYPNILSWIIWTGGGMEGGTEEFLCVLPCLRKNKWKGEI